MGKLVFKYGAMNSAKTASLCMMAHNFRGKGRTVFIIKPALDTRFEDGQVIWSRANMLQEADCIADSDMDLVDCVESPEKVDLILVDEAQFLTPAHVDQLRSLARAQTTVVCFGLRTDYRGHLFPASARLFEIADTIEEVKTPCTTCTNKGIMNAKFTCDVAGKRVILRSGSDVIEMGAEDKYCALCWACYVRE
jgi:thymidine kinase